MTPYQQKRKFSTILIFLVVAVGMLFLLILVINKSNQKEITFLTNSGNKIEIGSLNPKTKIFQNLITDSTQQQSINLHSGTYAVRYSATDEITQSAIIKLNQNLNLTSPVLDYNAAKLNQIVKSESTTIKKAVVISLGTSPPVIDGVMLYKHGDWATAHIKSIVSDPEPLSVILQKQADVWKIVAGPAILISIKEHPAIPADVIRTVNSQQYTTLIK